MKSKFANKKFYALGIVLLVLVVFRLCLPVIAKKYVNHELNKDPKYRGHVEAIDMSFIGGEFGARDLTIEQVDSKSETPLVSVKEMSVGIGWKELLQRKVSLTLRVEEAAITFWKETKEDSGKKMSKEEQEKEAKAAHEKFNHSFPLEIAQFDILNSRIHFKDITSKPTTDMYVDHINIHGKNFTNSEADPKVKFGRVEITARVMKSGELKINVAVNPRKFPPEFELDLKLADLNLVEFNDFFTAYGKFDIKKGTFGLYSEMACAEKKIKGYFKPLITDLTVSDFEKDKKKGILHAIWQKTVGAVAGVLKNQPKDRQGAKIPFEGDFDAPNIDVWATLTSVLENIFIKPLLPRLEEDVTLEDVKKDAAKERAEKKNSKDKGKDKKKDSEKKIDKPKAKTNNKK